MPQCEVILMPTSAGVLLAPCRMNGCEITVWYHVQCVVIWCVALLGACTHAAARWPAAGATKLPRPKQPWVPTHPCPRPCQASGTLAQTAGLS